ncbi:hypothetical protein F4777DRAFT_561035 [Nemania sp. FL0916]|nr:hypothetical protein F4777DRAFT_561035 [Nemania sp. FL0916]
MLVKHSCPSIAKRKDSFFSKRKVHLETAHPCMGHLPLRVAHFYISWNCPQCPTDGHLLPSHDFFFVQEVFASITCTAMDSPQQPASVPTSTFIGVGALLIALPALFVIARFAGNLRPGMVLKVADWLSLVAIILLAGTYGIFKLIVEAISDPTVPLLYTTRLLVASGPLSASATWFAKAPILFLYIQVFGVKRWLTVISYFTLAFTFVYIFAWNLWLLIEITPRNNMVTPEDLLKSSQLGSISGIAVGALGLVVDVVIFVLPLPIIINLKISLAKRISLFLVFITGLVAVITSAIALYFKHQSISGQYTDIKLAIILTLLELSIAIIVGCVPAVFSLWMSAIVESGVYTRIITAISNISLTSSRRSRSQRSHGSTNDASDSVKLGDRYYETLDDVRPGTGSQSRQPEYGNAVPLQTFHAS